MKIWKLVAGIISIVAFLIIMVQSCAVGALNAMENTGATTGSFGFFAGILILIGGILSICLRNATSKGANIALIIIFGLAALIGITSHGNYSDLLIWGIWAAINAVLALVGILVKTKDKTTEKNN